AGGLARAAARPPLTTSDRAIGLMKRLGCAERRMDSSSAVNGAWAAHARARAFQWPFVGLSQGVLPLLGADRGAVPALPGSSRTRDLGVGSSFAEQQSAAAGRTGGSHFKPTDRASRD